MLSYNILKKKINSYGKFIITFIGGNWGLASNTLHSIDLLSFLSNSKIKSCKNLLDKEQYFSKRHDFIEFKGLLIFETFNKNKLVIGDISKNKNDKSIYSGIKIETNKKDFIIHEKNDTLIEILKQKNNISIIKKKFKINFQSELTHLIIDKILSGKKINLVSLNNSFENEVIFINMLQNHLKSFNKKNNLIIT